jgi:hypothetical protein
MGRSMPFQTTATRIWKQLPGEPPAEAVGSALGALVKARRMRPQAARALPPEEQARILATLAEPGETVAASLLVALHLTDRRPLLGAFLDALGLAHEDGILKEEESERPTAVGEGRAREAVTALSGYPRDHVITYLNTLWLQDPERWAVLEKSTDWA